MEVPFAASKPEKVLVEVMHRAKICLPSTQSATVPHTRPSRLRVQKTEEEDRSRCATDSPKQQHDIKVPRPHVGKPASLTIINGIHRRRGPVIPIRVANALEQFRRAMRRRRATGRRGLGVLYGRSGLSGCLVAIGLDGGISRLRDLEGGGYGVGVGRSVACHAE